MKFKEYVELSELEEIEEGIGSTLSGILDAGISGVGTAGKQLFRGLANTGYGLARTGVDALGSTFGSEDSRKHSKNNLKKVFVWVNDQP